MPRIEVYSSDGKAVAGVEITKINHDEQPYHRAIWWGHVAEWNDDDSELSSVAISSVEAGEWSAIIKRPSARSVQAVRLTSLPEGGPLGWWHNSVGIGDADPARGRDVKVGVIDGGLVVPPNDVSLGHVHVLPDGPEAYHQKRLERGALPQTDHGNAVASLIFSRSLASGYQGIAPGADAFFWSAGFSHPSRPKGIGVGLNPALVAGGIRTLARDHGCDIINISAGDSEEPTEEIHSAILDAQEVGTLCFFASGNQGGKPLYPAQYPEAVAVAATGLRNYAPQHVMEHQHEVEAQHDLDAGEFVWAWSATGPDVQFIAPGCNVIWDFGGNAAHAVSGTSFAAPISAGTAAVILSRNRNRWSHLPRSTDQWNEKFNTLKDHVGLNSRHVSLGKLVVPIA